MNDPTKSFLLLLTIIQTNLGEELDNSPNLANNEQGKLQPNESWVFAIPVMGLLFAAYQIYNSLELLRLLREINNDLDLDNLILENPPLAPNHNQIRHPEENPNSNKKIEGWKNAFQNTLQIHAGENDYESTLKKLTSEDVNKLLSILLDNVAPDQIIIEKNSTSKHRKIPLNEEDMQNIDDIKGAIVEFLGYSQNTNILKNLAKVFGTEVPREYLDMLNQNNIPNFKDIDRKELPNFFTGAIRLFEELSKELTSEESFAKNLQKAFGNHKGIFPTEHIALSSQNKSNSGRANS